MEKKGCRRVRQILMLVFPIAVAQLQQVCIDFVSLVYAGHLTRTEYLAAIGFGITTTSVFGKVVLNGLSTGFNTLGS